ncbi:MAG: hypothetical protein HUU41_07865 [Bryobacteraceae bacterium]|nr:hypothetical protein [Bryobacterales bacterium]MEB2361744.1 hypothetical protein [Bryobacterales bacterium]NUN01015.1 hypothetical protein [Bryobacteraceae bacterium]
MALYSLLATVFEYPEPALQESLSRCMAVLPPGASESYAQLADFESAVRGKSSGQLQEIYTSAFDLRPDCTLNLGYHLFGDDGRRGLFLAELKDRMEARGIPLGVELPDHLSLVLRYLDVADEEDRLCLIGDCLIPALSRITPQFERSGNPYRCVLQSLLSLILYQHEELAISPGAVAHHAAAQRAVPFHILE